MIKENPGLLATYFGQLDVPPIDWAGAGAGHPREYPLNVHFEHFEINEESYYFCVHFSESQM